MNIYDILAIVAGSSAKIYDDVGDNLNENNLDKK